MLFSHTGFAGYTIRESGTVFPGEEFAVCGRQEFKEEGKPQVSLSFCPSRGRGNLPRSAERNSLLDSSEKLSAQTG